MNVPSVDAAFESGSGCGTKIYENESEKDKNSKKGIWKKKKTRNTRVAWIPDFVERDISNSDASPAGSVV